MKRLAALSIAIILFLGFIFGYNSYLTYRIENSNYKSYYDLNLYKYESKQNIENLLKENVIPVFGSSELSSAKGDAYPATLFKKGNSDFNMFFIGRGNEQSLLQAINLGAYADKVKSKKAVLIISPQWFTNPNTTPDIFSSRFKEAVYLEFLKNKNISVETKEKIANRTELLLESDQSQLNRISKYHDFYIRSEFQFFDLVYKKVYDSFIQLKSNHRYWNYIKNISITTENSDNFVKVGEIDFEALKKKAVADGKKECTNNNLYIYNDYYTTYIEPNLQSYKNNNINASYCTSEEYDDLKLFLDVCKENNIKVMLISVPIHGKWYDYTGFPKADREQYYQNIRDIAKNYNVKLTDFSKDEYTPYFLADIMHLGWKGWAEVSESIYKFYKQD